jgi:hypothetical protein
MRSTRRSAVTQPPALKLQYLCQLAEHFDIAVVHAFFAELAVSTCAHGLWVTSLIALTPRACDMVTKARSIFETLPAIFSS